MPPTVLGLLDPLVVLPGHGAVIVPSGVTIDGLLEAHPRLHKG